MRKFLILLILLTFTVPAYAATIYKWVDKDGVVNYTDDYNKVPTLYHDRVEALEFFTEKTSPVQTPKTTPGIKEEIRTDIYGRDETWWREKVHPWKEQLKEATANYERVHSKFMEKAEELSARRFGSRTQYKTNIIELDRLKEEMFKYGDQIAEAKEILEKLSKEAKETKADPAWLE
jgi:uncharacterized protein YfcZ (UPF0381/DUF406 family)